MTLSQTTLGVLITLATFAIIGLAVFLVRYVRFCYWLTKCWDDNGSGFNVSAFIGRLVSLYGNFRDYGLIRIITGSNEENSKMHIKNREDGLNMLDYLSITTSILGHEVEKTFLQLHHQNNISYKELRITYLHISTTHLGLLGALHDHISDMIDFSNGKYNRIDIHNTIHVECTKIPEELTDALVQMHKRILKEVGLRIPNSSRERFSNMLTDEGIGSLVIGLMLSNQKCKAMFGTDSGELPFHRDLV